MGVTKMKNFLIRIIYDIKKCENIDAYASVILAIIGIALKLFGIIDIDKVLTFTLVVITLVCIYNVENRHKMEDILHCFGTRGVINKEFPHDHTSKIEKAKELYVLGVHHSSFMSAHYDSLKKMIENGGKLYVMVSDPESAAIKMTSLRFADGGDYEQEKKRTEVNLSKFLELSKTYPGKVEVKTLDYLFEYSVIFINPNVGDGIAYIQRYTFRTLGGGNKPKLIYTPADLEWYELIQSEVHSFWSCGKIVS